MQPKDLIDAIMGHLILIDRVNETSFLMLRSALSGESDAVADHSENRTRIINNVERHQKAVEKRIDELQKHEITKELVDVLQAWVNDVSNWVALTDQIDTETSEILENLKQQTTQEIGNLYRSRTQFKGYNLNNVKK